MKRVALVSILGVLLAQVPAAYAWEPETTQAGLAEQAALASRLHARLVQLGFSGGLFEPLTIPPLDAPALMAALKLLSPTHGAVPDSRGRQSALAWLAAGAALADVPAANGANHFYDPATKHGWEKPSRGIIGALTNTVREAVGRAALPAHGIPAPDWVVAKENPFNVDAFYAQFAKAVTAATPAERSRHMAAALVAAGAILHALGDLGAPSRVRGDSAAHLEPLGGGPDDLGSRFERIAALAFGRLGVPGPSRVITRTTLRAYFTAEGDGIRRDRAIAPAVAPTIPSVPAAPDAGAATDTTAPTTEPAPSDTTTPTVPTLLPTTPALPMPPPIPAGTPRPGEGLADLIARSYFSSNTLPRPARVAENAKPALVRPYPAVPTRLNLMVASRDDGALLRDSAGTCLARYAVENGLVTFTTDDDCMLEQVAAILPEVASFETGLLEFLLRGELTVEVDQEIVVRGANLAAGTLTILNEDTRGVRTPIGTYSTVQTSSGVIAQVARPAAGARIVVVYTGKDLNGEPLVAVGASAIPVAQ